MKIVQVTFPNSTKLYAYKTKLNLVVGEEYRIENEFGHNYDDVPVRVQSISDESSMPPRSRELRRIVKAVSTTTTKWKIDAEPQKVIHQYPCTIVIWNDGTKTIVRCQPDDVYNKKTGFFLCLMKKVYGNDGRFNEILKTVFPEEYEQTSTSTATTPQNHEELTHSTPAENVEQDDKDDDGDDEDDGWDAWDDEDDEDEVDDDEYEENEQKNEDTLENLFARFFKIDKWEF